MLMPMHKIYKLANTNANSNVAIQILRKPIRDIVFCVRMFQPFDFQVLCFGFCVSRVCLSSFVFHVLYFRLYVRFSATKKNKEK